MDCMRFAVAWREEGEGRWVDVGHPGTRNYHSRTPAANPRRPDRGNPKELSMTDGTVVNFDPSRGFGFIRAKGLRDDVFVHITDIAGGLPLKAGQQVRFEVVQGEKGPRAKRVDPGRIGVPPWLGAGLILMTLVGGLGYGFHLLGLQEVGAGFAALNLATYLVYGWDKHLARMNERRIPESTLLGLALIGGSPGAALAMWAFRHKTRKGTFLTAFAVVVLVQIAAIGYWFSRA
jgi:uncharacterized membrane protein YsdA (DUF1294 family)/cold shock CspA family protein